VARFVAPQHSTKLLPEFRLEKRDRARAERRKAEMLTSGGRRLERADKLPKVACCIAEMLTSRLAKPGGVLKAKPEGRSVLKC
jgi:hypothetical protein